MPRGGKREGAGRPVGTINEIVQKRVGVASEMCDKLSTIADWNWIFEQAKKNNDYRTMSDVLRYWTDKRDGKAPQAIQVSGEISYTETLLKAKERLRAHRESTN